MGDSKWMLDLRQVSAIYFGFIIVVLALSKDILPLETYCLDTSLLGIGIAIIGLGWALLPKKLRESDITLNKEKSETNNLKGKIEKLDKKLNDTENIITSHIIKMGEELKRHKNKE